MTTLRQTPLTCSGHTRPVTDLAFSDITEFGYFLISACKDGKPMLRQGDTGDWVGTFEGHKGAVWGANLNSDASKAATAAADFSAKVWDAVKGEEQHSFSHKHIVKSVDFSHDSTKLLTGSNEKLLKVFDLGNPEADPEVLPGHEASIKSAKWMKDNKRIVSAAEDKTIRVWDATSNKEVHQLKLVANPSSIELSADGQVITVSSSNLVTFFDTNNFEKLKEYDVPTQVYTATLHPDKSVFICGGDDFKLYKFDYGTGIEIDSYKGHFGPIHTVRFSPDGELYASGSEDGTLRLWQTTVGKTYGLWKCITPDEIVNNIDSTPLIKGEA